MDILKVIIIMIGFYFYENYINKNEIFIEVKFYFIIYFIIVFEKSK